MCYLRSSVWHLAVIIIVPEKEVDPGVPWPTDEACLAVTKHSLLTSHGWFRLTASSLPSPLAVQVRYKSTVNLCCLPMALAV